MGLPALPALFLSHIVDQVEGSKGSAHVFTNNNYNNNNILYSSQREIKAVVRSHNQEHISIILSHETHAHTRTYTLLDIRPLSVRGVCHDPWAGSQDC